MNIIAYILYIYTSIRHVFICFLWFSFLINARISGLEVNELINIDTLQMLEFIYVPLE